MGVGTGAGVFLLNVPLDTRVVSTCPTRITSERNPLIRCSAATLTPQRRAIALKVSPLRTVYGFAQLAALTATVEDRLTVAELA